MRKPHSDWAGIYEKKRGNYKKNIKKPRHTISLNWYEARELCKLAHTGQVIELYRKASHALDIIEAKHKRGKR